MKPVRIIIFAKAPWPGLAKTRLIPALGAEGAAQLAQHMLSNTVTAAVAAAVGPVELCVTPAIDDPAWRGFEPDPAIIISHQGDGDLGQRMARAAQRALAQGQPTLLIGTDCAEMSAALLQQAAARLASSDSVIYPTADGGYALLGLTVFADALFCGIAWSTDSVAADTIAKMHVADWRVNIGATLHDIDTPDDLHWLDAGRVTKPPGRSACTIVTINDEAPEDPTNS